MKVTHHNYDGDVISIGSTSKVRFMNWEHLWEFTMWLPSDYTLIGVSFCIWRYEIYFRIRNICRAYKKKLLPIVFEFRYGKKLTDADWAWRVPFQIGIA